MSGVPNPQYPITEPFGAAAQPEYIVLPIPIPDQTLIEPGAASYDTGFAPINMTDLAAGGIPPRGKDMNGILYSITQYCALMQAGQIVPFDAAVAAAIGGYKIGARVQSLTPERFTWTNTVDGNQNDPDVNATGWAADVCLYATPAVSGAVNNFILPGASDYVLDMDTAAGDANISGFVAQRNSQRLIVSNTGANLLTFLALSNLSAAANRIRAPSDLSLVQNQTIQFQWSATVSLWLMV